MPKISSGDSVMASVLKETDVHETATSILGTMDRESRWTALGQSYKELHQQLVKQWVTQMDSDKCVPPARAFCAFAVAPAL